MHSNVSLLPLPPTLVFTLSLPLALKELSLTGGTVTDSENGEYQYWSDA
ncbi:MAG: hypothetical protein JWM37_108 [Candidatus Saccharibacteria bacterium]|nr:hypothetical protein [Candidatus Saccharibacteria bacterium]